MPEDQADQPLLYFEFTEPSGSVPTFANLVTASELGGEIIINFGFVDPIAVERKIENQPDNEQKEIKVPASFVARIAINPLVASDLFDRLKEILTEIEEENA
ncbi:MULTISPECIES: hypothetical protein [unclassified Coleofasciculus]|uniref:hypothetical protein n=1 Tax=unclassified Coleofasciculus TaxID=2692782 RepID=UPI001882F7FB|nr:MULTISPECIES: hypothetical protein [unclassified Coleofasciculus]MBE9130113.1 hypothetical protein [Coleofasciculus sp. LEGE 07081]MBE9152454.1 hypothetical protein [Coleofasciculus sp. LEGE 07092]